jgi:hypothetical protein
MNISRPNAASPIAKHISRALTYLARREVEHDVRQTKRSNQKKRPTSSMAMSFVEKEISGMLLLVRNGGSK